MWLSSQLKSQAKMIHKEKEGSAKETRDVFSFYI